MGQFILTSYLAYIWLGNAKQVPKSGYLKQRGYCQPALK